MYSKTVWQITHMGEKLSATQEKYNEALKIDLYAVAWTLERISKVTLDVLVTYHMHSLGLSLFLFVHIGSMEATVVSLQSTLSPVPRRVLEIILKASLQLKNQILIN